MVDIEIVNWFLYTSLIIFAAVKAFIKRKNNGSFGTLNVVFFTTTLIVILFPFFLSYIACNFPQYTAGNECFDGGTDNPINGFLLLWIIFIIFVHVPLCFFCIYKNWKIRV